MSFYSNNSDVRELYVAYEKILGTSRDVVLLKNMARFYQENLTFQSFIAEKKENELIALYTEIHGLIINRLKELKEDSSMFMINKLERELN